MDTHRPQWYSTGAQSALPQRSNKVHPSRHTAALLALLAACSAIPDDTAASAGTLYTPAASPMVLRVVVAR